VNYENGLLGYPTSDEVFGLRDGGAFQHYEGGTIFHAPATGARVTSGTMRDVYFASGNVDGVLGYPTSNETFGLRDGGSRQQYQRGAIVKSAAGTFMSLGAIGGVWGSTGAENGRLGYPTSAEYALAVGVTAQDFQGGRITYSTEGIRVIYNP
jgi:uncharacterized protein with LGFP repeats